MYLSILVLYNIQPIKKSALNIRVFQSSGITLVLVNLKFCVKWIKIISNWRLSQGSIILKWGSRLLLLSPAIIRHCSRFILLLVLSLSYFDWNVCYNCRFCFIRLIYLVQPFLGHFQVSLSLLIIISNYLILKLYITYHSKKGIWKCLPGPDWII